MPPHTGETSTNTKSSRPSAQGKVSRRLMSCRLMSCREFYFLFFCVFAVHFYILAILLSILLSFISHPLSLALSLSLAPSLSLVLFLPVNQFPLWQVLRQASFVESRLVPSLVVCFVGSRV